MQKSLKHTAKICGLLLATTLVIMTFTAYAINLSMFVNTTYGLAIYAVIISFGFYSVFQTKSNQGGVFSFKDAFSVYFITILIGLIIHTAVTYVLFNFIDNQAAIILKEKSIEQLTLVYKNMHKTPEEINKMIAIVKADNLYSLKNCFTAMVTSYLLPLSIIGLLIAAVMKKSNTNAK